MLDLFLSALVAHPDLYRGVSAALAFLAGLAHTYRAVTTWRQLTALTQAMALVVGMSAFVASLAQARALALDAPPNEFTLAVLALQAAVIVVALAWKRLILRPSLILRRPRPTPGR